jgi:hypothetical protein
MKTNKNIALNWWDDLPIQNLENMDDSWVGYVHKYLPNRGGIYALTDDEILYIWKQEQYKKTFIGKMIKEIFC